MENLFDIIRKILDEHTGSMNNPNDFSMSYTFNSGMDKPEFKINGKEVNPELLKKLEKYIMDLSSFEIPTQSFLNNSQAFHKNMTLQNKISDISGEIDENIEKEIFYDIFDEGEKLKIIIELPGVSKYDISITADSNEIEIKTPHHHKLIQLPVPVNNDIAKARYTNGILNIELEKARSNKKKKNLQID